MIKKSFLTLLLIGAVFTALSKPGILDRVISVEIQNTPIKIILSKIEERASVRFTYNPELIDVSKVVSLSIKKKTVAYGLSLIFDRNVRFKEVGNHIVLLRNENAAEVRERRKSNRFTVFEGKITDKETGNVLEAVSVYDVDARYASVSDNGGHYRLKVPKAEAIRSLYVRKKGYYEFVFVVDATADSVIHKNIQLQPIPSSMEKLSPKPVERVYQPVEDRVLSGALVSYDTYVHGENLEEIKEGRIAQISLVPSVSIGSNLSTNGLIVNNFSLNVLAGYSNGIDGAEFGGIVNMVKGDARWLQAAGISNLVGGNFTGAQFGGIMTSVRKDFLGCQAGGIIAMIGGNFMGIQAGGISAFTHKHFKGAQFAGIAAITKGDFIGLQAGGIFSAVRSGFYGVQLAGISNVVFEKATGLQIAGIHNTAYDSLNGGQISGISNFSRGGVNLLQIGGIANYAKKNNGLQLSGIFNFARVNNGLQISLLNISNESNGVSIGLFNFVRKGYHKTELSANEILPINVVFKTGTERFYNSYHFGYKPGENPFLASGLGFGTKIPFNHRWGLNADISTQVVFEGEINGSEFANLHKFSFTFDYQPAKWIAFFAGPSFNVNIMYFKNDEGIYHSNAIYNPVFTSDWPNARAVGWVGGRVGIRL